MMPRYTGDENLAEVALLLAERKQEGTYWDFKREWHEANSDLVHDIICLANNPGGETAMLLIGIDEDADYAIRDIANSKGRKNTQDVNSALASAHFAGAWPSVRVVPVEMGKQADGSIATIDVVVIEPNPDAVPYYLTHDYKKGKCVRAGAIYSRRQDGNTPVDATASPLLTERLWRRHFGLDRTPLERLPGLLAHPDEWEDTMSMAQGESDYAFYNVRFPEYTVVYRFNDDKNAWNYLMLASPFNHAATWLDFECYYHQTMLYRGTGCYSDHHVIPLPAREFLRPPCDDFDHECHYLYTCYMEGSIEQRLEGLFMKNEGSDGKESHEWLRRMLPVLRTPTEKTEFERYLRWRWDEFTERVKGYKHRPYCHNIPKDEKDLLVEKATEASVIVEMLEEYRREFGADAPSEAYEGDEA